MIKMAFQLVLRRPNLVSESFALAWQRKQRTCSIETYSQINFLVSQPEVLVERN